MLLDGRLSPDTLYSLWFLHSDFKLFRYVFLHKEHFALSLFDIFDHIVVTQNWYQIECLLCPTVLLNLHLKSPEFLDQLVLDGDSCKRLAMHMENNDKLRDLILPFESVAAKMTEPQEKFCNAKVLKTETHLTWLRPTYPVTVEMSHSNPYTSIHQANPSKHSSTK